MLSRGDGHASALPCPLRRLSQVQAFACAPSRYHSIPHLNSGSFIWGFLLFGFLWGFFVFCFFVSCFLFSPHCRDCLPSSPVFPIVGCLGHMSSNTWALFTLRSSSALGRKCPQASPSQRGGRDPRRGSQMLTRGGERAPARRCRAGRQRSKGTWSHAKQIGLK